MNRWYVGIRPNGTRAVFSDSTGADPTAATLGYAEICGPYRSEQEAARAARAKPSVPGRLRNPKR